MYHDRATLSLDDNRLHTPLSPHVPPISLWPLTHGPLSLACLLAISGHCLCAPFPYPHAVTADTDDTGTRSGPTLAHSCTTSVHALTLSATVPLHAHTLLATYYPLLYHCMHTVTRTHCYWPLTHGPKPCTVMMHAHTACTSFR